MFALKLEMFGLRSLVYLKELQLFFFSPLKFSLGGIENMLNGGNDFLLIFFILIINWDIFLLLNVAFEKKEYNLSEYVFHFLVHPMF